MLVRRRKMMPYTEFCVGCCNSDRRLSGGERGANLSFGNAAKDRCKRKDASENDQNLVASGL